MYISEKLIRWILFMVNPFLSAIVSFKDYSKPITINIFWAFCVFYGFTFAIGNESIGNDILEYLAEVRYLYSLSSADFPGFLAYFRQTGEIDILRVFLSYVISRFTDSQVVLTTVYALIFGFFYSRNIWYILNSLENRITDLEKIVFLAIVLLIPIWFINGFRMWTAFHVFFYGLLPFILENKRNRLIFVFLSFLVHFSFLIPIGIVVIYLFVGNRLTVLFVAFMISIFISNINIKSINSIAEIVAPQNVLDRSANYLDEGVVEARSSAFASNTVNWYVVWYTLGLRYALYILLFYIFVFGDPRIKLIPEWKRLLSLTFLFFTVGNLLVGIPSGGRFLNFGYLLALLVLLFYLDAFRNDAKTRLTTLILSPALVLFIIVAIRNGLYSTSFMSLMGNPVIALFSVGETSSINDFIK